MKVNAIIAEYNPFHNGHKYQLESCRTITDADYTIVAMSGNFMQRGTPALLHKYIRANMALQNGADLVLEIPSFYACGSAEFFAKGALALLDKLGVVDYLCFGSEHGDLNRLYQPAQLLASEPKAYQKLLIKNLSQGYSFPAARSRAVSQYCKDIQKENIPEDLLTLPNNILGVEYIKALIHRNSSIKPVTIKRLGNDYHQQSLEPFYSSALAIRSAVFNQQNLDILATQMPANSLNLMKQHFESTSPIQTDDLSQLLLYRLLSEEKKGYQQYMDVTADLSDKIQKYLYRFTGFEQFCQLLKSKDNTYTRISRSLLHILLNITSEEIHCYQALDYVPYARILGLRKSASPLLNSIKQNTSIPLISKLADADQVLEACALDMLHKEIQITHIYNGIEALKSGSMIRNEYRTPMVIIP